MYTLVFFYSVLLFFLNVVVLAFLLSAQSSFKMARLGRESLLDDEIMQELRADRLSGVRSDCESDKCSCDDDDDDDDDNDFGHSASQKGRKRAPLEVSDSNVNDDDDSWTNNDDIRNLDQYLGNTSLTFTPDDPTSISEVVNRLLGMIFFKFL
jgi:hypothetical protein